MPKNRLQTMIFSGITVVLTVHAYVFFSLYVIHGGTFIEISGQSGVLGAIRALGGRTGVWYTGADLGRRTD